MYAVRSGSVEFRQRGANGEPVVLRRVGVGQLFGEIALIEDVPRTADAIALENVGGAGAATARPSEWKQLRENVTLFAASTSASTR